MMKILKVAVLILCSFVLLIGGFANAAGEDSRDGISEKIDKAAAGWIEDGTTVGVVVSVVQGGQAVLSKGYGYADKEAGIKADAGSTAFRIGSVSKVFVAQAAMQLREKGMIDLNKPIDDYLEEDFPAFEYPVTMHDLLTHTAGFEEKDVGLFIRQGEETGPLKEVIRKNIPAQVYRPKEVSAYSNYGISLAGYVVERIAGEPFYDYAAEKIFEPLNMADTTFSRDRAAAPTVSKGYGEDGRERAEGIVTLYPSGSVTTTADDMAKYMMFLLSNEDSGVLGNDAKAGMFARQFTMDESIPGIGYVWGRYEQNRHLMYGHMGGTDNFNTLLFLCPDLDLGVFISCNTQNTGPDIAKFWTEIIQDLYGEAEPPAPGEYSAQTAPADISGVYVPARSNFTGEEKLLRIPETIRINGSAEKGFSFGDAELQRVGENRYFHAALGYITFTEKNGRFYFTNEEGASYLRAPWNEGLEWQAFVLGLFLAVSGISALASLIMLVKSIKRKEKWRMIVNVIGIALFVLPAVIIGKCIAYFSDYEYALGGEFTGFLRAAVFALILIGCGQLAATFYMWVKKKGRMRVRILYSISCASFLLLAVWLYQLNLIF